MNDHRSIDGLDTRLDDRQKRIDELIKKLDVASKISSSSTASIYRIPASIRKLNLAVYEPWVLSLGPYHHGKPEFQAMDELKWWYFKSFLRRNKHKNVKDYYELVENNEKKACSAYSEQEPSVNFVEMMLLDCCFVLEFLLIISGYSMQGGGGEEGEIISPIHKSVWTHPYVVRDMLLLENQLPFFLLEELLKLNIPVKTPYLPGIVLDMLSDVMPGMIQRTLTGREGATVNHIHHILHLMHSLIIPTVLEDHPETVHGVASQEQAVQMPVSMPEDHPRSCWFKMFKHGAKLVPSQVQRCCLSSGDANDASEGTRLRGIPSAKRLSEAGVVFKRKKKYKSFLDVTFDRGTMEIPQLQIFGYIDSIFTPIRYGLQIYFTSYAFLMNFLIDTTADVQLLEQEGIIVSIVTSDEEIATLFNQLGNKTTIDNDSYLKNVYDAIKVHCDKRCNRWKAILNHKYLGNPWAIISVAAASILLALTILQTLYALLTYYR